MPPLTPAETDPSARSSKPFVSRRLWLMLPLVAVALFETWDGWDNFPALKAARSGETQINAFATAHLLSQALLGFAAFVFAITGRIRHAIIALAANTLLRWLTVDVFDPVNWRISNVFSAQETMMQLVVIPVAALTAAVLAAREIRLGLATLLICLPTLYNIVLLVGFMIGVAIYGF